MELFGFNRKMCWAGCQSERPRCTTLTRHLRFEVIKSASQHGRSGKHMRYRTCVVQIADAQLVCAKLSHSSIWKSRTAQHTRRSLTIEPICWQNWQAFPHSRCNLCLKAARPPLPEFLDFMPLGSSISTWYSKNPYFPSAF